MSGLHQVPSIFVVRREWKIKFVHILDLMPFFWENTEHSGHVWCDQIVLMSVLVNYYICLRCVIIYNKKYNLYYVLFHISA